MSKIELSLSFDGMPQKCGYTPPDLTGDLTHHLTVHAKGGNNMGFRYLWTVNRGGLNIVVGNMATIPIKAVPGTATYTATVRNAHGDPMPQTCSAYITYTPSPLPPPPPPPSLNVIVKLVNCKNKSGQLLCCGSKICRGKNDQLVATATGGVAPYNFQWTSHGVIFLGNFVTNLCTGNYVVTVTDSTGVSATCAIDVVECEDCRCTRKKGYHSRK